MMMASGSSSRSKSVGRLEAALAASARIVVVGDVADVALAPLELGDLGRVDVEAEDGDPALARRPGPAAGRRSPGR